MRLGISRTDDHRSLDQVIRLPSGSSLHQECSRLHQPITPTLLHFQRIRSLLILLPLCLHELALVATMRAISSYISPSMTCVERSEHHPRGKYHPGQGVFRSAMVCRLLHSRKEPCANGSAFLFQRSIGPGRHQGQRLHPGYIDDSPRDRPEVAAPDRQQLLKIQPS